MLVTKGHESPYYIARWLEETLGEKQDNKDRDYLTKSKFLKFCGKLNVTNMEEADWLAYCITQYEAFNILNDDDRLEQEELAAMCDSIVGDDFPESE